MRLKRAIECAVLFVGVPTAWALGWIPVHILALLLAMTTVIVVALMLDRSFDRRALWNAGAVTKREFRRIVAQFAVGAALLTLAVWTWAPELLFAFPRRNPHLYIVVMVLYPLVSVYPQEVAYRAFFFHRYGALFPGRVAMNAASAVAFGYMHVVFHNWIAVALCLAGGALFAWTYARTRSTLLASIEHALYGNFIFTVGLGIYFFHGTMELTRDVMTSINP